MQELSCFFPSSAVSSLSSSDNKHSVQRIFLIKAAFNHLLLSNRPAFPEIPAPNPAYISGAALTKPQSILSQFDQSYQSLPQRLKETNIGYSIACLAGGSIPSFLQRSVIFFILACVSG
ncbi:MAG: hypothetical protein J1F06_06815, partial [Prevotellaceae bacterium]|nr:hypothetical protein [Prevotellaceae bacterium]